MRTRRGPSEVLAIALLLGGIGSSCVLGGFDFDKAAPGSGASASASAGAAGSQGAGAGEACTSAADCPGVDDECTHRSCDDGACTMLPVPADTPVANQTPQDCKQRVCDGKGGVESKPDPSDPLDDAKECTDDKCDDGVPKNVPSPVGTRCGAKGTLSCDGKGNCVGCSSSTECGMDSSCLAWECQMGVCVPMPKAEGESCGACQTCQGGACANAPADTPDPAACPVKPCNPGTCNGAGGCQLSPAGTACGAASCSGDSVLGPGSCDPSGGCTPGLPTTDCTPYTCVPAAAACGGSCSTDLDCALSYGCEPNGHTCEDCKTCPEFLMMPDPLAQAPCTASEPIIDALKNCVCMTCMGPCQTTLCMKDMPSPLCTQCIQTSCSTELMACNDDDGK